MRNILNKNIQIVFIALLKFLNMATKSVQISNNGFNYILNANLSLQYMGQFVILSFPGRRAKHCCCLKSWIDIAKE